MCHAQCPRSYLHSFFEPRSRGSQTYNAYRLRVERFHSERDTGDKPCATDRDDDDIYIRHLDESGCPSSVASFTQAEIRKGAGHMPQELSLPIQQSGVTPAGLMATKLSQPKAGGFFTEDHCNWPS